MKCSVFIAASLDGFIARKDGGIDWLHTAGRQEVDLGDEADMGFNDFIASVDCMIMGRKCMEVISAMNLTPEHWPYGELKIFVLSQTLKQAPDNMEANIEIIPGDIPALIERCDKEGFKHAYIDGGQTIQSFLALKLINHLTITRIPVLLGEGIPLFAYTGHDIQLSNASVKLYANDLLQENYDVSV
jgi:dihydrofolate reductase